MEEKKSMKMVFEQFSSIPHLFLNTARTESNKIALKFFEGDVIKEFSFADYKDRVYWLAAGMISLGLKPKEHVSILAYTSHRWCICDQAILNAACASVTIFRTLDYEQVHFEVEDSDSVGIFVDGMDNLQKVLKTWSRLKKLRFVIIVDDVDYDNGKDLREKSNIQSIPEYADSPHKNKIFHYNEILKKGKEYLNENPEIIQNRIENIKENDLATIIYTSGTTGIPKGVMLSHKNFISDAMMGFIAAGIRDNEISCCYLPLAHSFAHTVEYIGSIVKGNCLCFAQDYDSLVSNLHDFQPTAMIGVPYVFEQIHKKVWENIEILSKFKQMMFRNGISYGKKICGIVQNKKYPSTLQTKIHNFYKNVVFSPLKEKLGGKLRVFVSGGAALNPEISKFFWAAGIQVLEGYGLSETAPITHVNRPPVTTDVYPSNKIGTIGPVIGWDKWGSEVPYRAVEARVSDNGELLISGPNVMIGYYKRPEENEEVFVEKDGKRWLRTGDLAEIDEDGYAKIIGRAKHLIVLKTGKKVAPNLVEPTYQNNLYIDQLLLLGEGEKFISALIVPNFDKKEDILERLGLKSVDDQDFCTNRKVLDFYKEQLKQTQEGKLSHFERIKEFRLIPEPWTEENKMLTPSLKVKRERVLEKYEDLITKIYN